MYMLRVLSLALCWLLLVPTFSPAASFTLSENELNNIEQLLSRQRAELVALRLSLQTQSETSKILRSRLQTAEQHTRELSESLQRASSHSETLTARLARAQSEAEALRTSIESLRTSFEAYESEAERTVRRANIRAIIASSGAFLAGAAAGFLAAAYR